MAGADFCFCIVCSKKLFYDVDIYKENKDLCYIKALCNDCAKTYKLEAIKKELS